MTNTKIRTNTPPKKKAANIQVDKLRTFEGHPFKVRSAELPERGRACLLYTSDAADDRR